MKVDQLYPVSRRVWVVTGDPLPPPERGTHWLELPADQMPPLSACEWDFEDAGACYRWSTRRA